MWGLSSRQSLVRCPRLSKLAFCRVLCTPRHTEPSRELLPKFMDDSMRGVGQVVFCNSAVSGAVMLAGLAVADPWLASLAATGVFSATAFSRFARLDPSMVSAGLSGYNGCLVGCALATFLEPWSPTVAFATVAAAVTTVPLTVSFKQACGSVPQWTWSFNVTTLSILAYIRPFADASPTAEMTLSLQEWLCVPLVGVSQANIIPLFNAYPIRYQQHPP